MNGELAADALRFCGERGLLPAGCVAAKLVRGASVRTSAGCLAAALLLLSAAGASLLC